MVDVVRLSRAGVRGESFADVARRVGSIGGVVIEPDATDEEVLDALGGAVGSAYKGVLDAGDNIDTLVAEGTYIVVTATSPGTYPLGISTYGILEVQGFGNFISQRMTGIMPGTAPAVWARTKTTAYGLSEWAKSGGALSGKNIVNLSDSIFKGNLSDRTLRVGSYIADRAGATFYNGGVGGAQAMNHTVAQFVPFGFGQLATAIATNTWTTQDANKAYVDGQGGNASQAVAVLKALDWDSIDAVIVAFGHNDRSNRPGGTSVSDWIGTIADTGTSTFYGAYNSGISTLLAFKPHLQILLVAPYERGDAIGTIEPYVTAIKAIGVKYKLPVLDLYLESGVNALTEASILDGGHLHPGSALLYERIGGMAAARLTAVL